MYGEQLDPQTDMSGIKTLLEKFAPEGESPAFLNPREENILMKAGGSGTTSNNPFGITSFAGWEGEDHSQSPHSLGGEFTEVTGDIPRDDMLGVPTSAPDPIGTEISYDDSGISVPAPDISDDDFFGWGSGSGGSGGSGGNNGDDLGFWDILGAIPEVLASILTFGIIDLETTGKDILPEFTDRAPQKPGIEANPWNALNIVAPGIGSLVTYATGTTPYNLIGGDDDGEIISGDDSEDKLEGGSALDVLDAIGKNVSELFKGLDLTPGPPHGGGGSTNKDFTGLEDVLQNEYGGPIKPRVVAPAPAEVIEEEEVIPIYDYNKGYEPQDYYDYDPYSAGYVGEKRWPIVFGPGDYSEWDKI